MRETALRMLRAAAGLLMAAVAPGCDRTTSGRDELPPGIANISGSFADINPRWSHDGKYIAFFRSTGDRSLQLFIADGRLERPAAVLEPELLCPDRPYSPELARYSSPDTLSWSPDDHSIAFERIEWFRFEDGERLPGTGIWSINIRNGRVVPLAIHPAHYLSVFYYYHYPAWSPDGRYISFVAESLHGEREIAVHPLSGQKPQEVRLRFDNYADSDWPSWAPALAAAGTAPTLYFRQGIRRDPGIETTETIRGAAPGSATPSSGEQWRLTAATFRSFTRTAEPGRAITLRSGHFAWSPDGRQLAFTLTPDPNDYSRSELWAMRRDGSGARRVSPADGRGYIAPVWVGTDRLGALSPRGARFDVVLLGIGHGGGRTLGAIDSSDCDWSPDRSRIVYAVRRAHGPSDNTDITTTLREIKTGLQVGQP